MQLTGCSVGLPAVKPLVRLRTPARLLDLVRSLPPSSLLLPHILKALRNILVSIADCAWGHLRGVVLPQQIVQTGLEEDELELSRSPKGKEVAEGWKHEFIETLGLVFQV